MRYVIRVYIALISWDLWCYQGNVSLIIWNLMYYQVRMTCQLHHYNSIFKLPSSMIEYFSEIIIRKLISGSLAHPEESPLIMPDFFLENGEVVFLMNSFNIRQIESN